MRTARAQGLGLTWFAGCPRRRGMRIRPGQLPGVWLLEPEVHRDPRGFFMELWNGGRGSEAGLSPTFVQDNVSFSRGGVLRGLHFQNPRPQAKLVSVLEGEVMDVVVDLRRGSATFGRWAGERLSAANRLQCFVPAEFAHGFQVVSESALVHYKVTEFYEPGTERGIAWDDPDLGIVWPVRPPEVSARDARQPRLRDVPDGLLFP